MIKHVKLTEYQVYELTTPDYPQSHSGSVSCTMKFEALNGMKPAIEFVDWQPANCRTDRFHIIDRKEQNLYYFLTGSNYRK